MGGTQPLRYNSAMGLLLLLTAIVAQATTFADRPFPNVVYDAKGVVRGKVVTSHSDWSSGQDGVRRLYTYYEIQPQEIFKQAQGMPANPTQNVFVRELGGEKDGIGMQVAGAAQFEKGEDAVVFTSGQNLDGSFDVRGLSTGKFNIERDRDGVEYLTGGALAVSAQNESAHSDTTSGGHPVQSTGTWTLQSLREMVREQQSTPPPAEKIAQNSNASLPVSAPAPQRSGGPSTALAPSLQSQASGSAVGASSQKDSTDDSNKPIRPSIKWLVGVLIGGGLYWIVSRKRS